MSPRPAFVQMRVNGGVELAAEGVNPVAGFAQETVFVALIASAYGAGIFGHVRGLKGLTIIEDGWIVPAVKVGIGFDKEMIGEHSAAIAEQSAQKVGGLGTTALPGLKPGLQMSGQAEAEDQQGGERQRGQARG